MTPSRLLWIFLIALTAMRLVLIGQIELSPDEAYYQLWSQKLDWWYFSKGPGVALTMRLSTMIFGPTEFGIRFFAPILGLGTSLILHALARRLYGAKVAFWTVVVINLTPIFNAGSLVMTIDPLSIFFWSAALYTVWRALEKSPAFSLWWPLTGLLIGLGWLAKMTNAAQLASIILLLILTPRYRVEFRRLGFWSMLIAFVPFVAQFVWWQQSHGWPTTAHLASRGGLEKSWMSFEFPGFFEWFGAHFAVYSPLIFAAMLFALWANVHDSLQRWWVALLKSASSFIRRCLSHWVLSFAGLMLVASVYLLAKGGFGEVAQGAYDQAAKEIPGALIKALEFIAIVAVVVFIYRHKEMANMHWKARFLLAFTLPLFLAYAWVALHHDSEPNWTAPAVVTLTLLTVAFWHEETDERPWVPKLAGVALVLSALLSVLLLDMDLSRRLGLAWPYARDPTSRLRGWHEAARLVGDFRQQYEAEEKKPVFLIANHYGVAAILTHYLPGDPRIEVPGHPAIYVPESPVAENQFHFWGRYDEFEPRTAPITDDMNESSEEGLSHFAGRTALYITDRPEENPPRIFKATFEKCELIAVYDQTRRGLPLRQIRIFTCKNYKPLSL